MRKPEKTKEKSGAKADSFKDFQREFEFEFFLGKRNKKPYSIKGNAFEVLLPKMKMWYPFHMSHHAMIRIRERHVTIMQVVAAILRVSHLLRPGDAEGTPKRIIIPSYEKEIAVLLEFGPNKGTVVTVLDYPAMSLPEDVPVLDWRQNLE